MSANLEEVERQNRIAQIHARMATLQPDSKEYAACAEMLVKLEPLKKEKPSWRPSADTLLTVVGNVGVVILIIAYEQKDVWTTKSVDIGKKLFH